jgi:hypothetical protein
MVQVPAELPKIVDAKRTQRTGSIGSPLITFLALAGSHTSAGHYCTKLPPRDPRLLGTMFYLDVFARATCGSGKIRNARERRCQQKETYAPTKNGG